MFKFLPLAMTFINFMTALIFMNSCKPFVKRDNITHFSFPPNIHVNCTKTLVLSSTEKYVEAGTCNADLIESYYVLKTHSFMPEFLF